MDIINTDKRISLMKFEFNVTYGSKLSYDLSHEKVKMWDSYVELI